METLPQRATGTESWVFFVPSAFQSSIDAWTTWTRKKRDGVLTGVFSRGDTLYDSPKGYLVWSEAVKHFRTCIQVVEAVGDTVKFRILRPHDGGVKDAGQFTLPAEELIAALKTGDLPV